VLVLLELVMEHQTISHTVTLKLVRLRLLHWTTFQTQYNIYRI
jgi:hypothetical protein